MKLESQVCSLEQAKTLNSLGIVQGVSIFYYYDDTEQLKYNNGAGKGHYFNAFTCFSAFTVAELGVMLSALSEKEHDAISEYNSVWGKWQCFLLDQNIEELWQVEGKTEAEARANMLIYCLELVFPHLTPEDCNSRLLNS